MANCQYFKQTRVNGPLMNPIGGTPKQLFTDVNWCGHQRSPASERIATTTIGGEKILTCCGDMSRCQIPIHNR